MCTASWSDLGVTDDLGSFQNVFYRHIWDIFLLSPYGLIQLVISCICPNFDISIGTYTSITEYIN